jgi:hypothetical protein
VLWFGINLLKPDVDMTFPYSWGSATQVSLIHASAIKNLNLCFKMDKYHRKAIAGI